MVGLLQARVRDHEPAAVEAVVAEQAVHERPGPLHELRLLRRELVERLPQAVRDRDLAAVEGAHELLLVVAGHADRGAGLDHVHHQAQHAGGVGAAVDQVADEHGRAALRVREPLPAEPAQQRLQFGAAAVDVADDVEGAGQLGPVGPGPLVRDLRGVDLVEAAQHVDPPEPVVGDPAQRAAQLLALADHHAGAEVAVGPGGVALDGHLLGHVEHDRVAQHVVLPGQVEEAPAGRVLDVGGVDHGEQAPGQPHADDVVQQVECRGRGRLVVLVVGDQAAAEVGGDDLRGLEVLPGERRLAAARDADEHHQRELRNADHG